MQLEVYRDTAFKIIDQGTVDDDQWYTVRVYWKDCAGWLRSQKKTQQWEHPFDARVGMMFDIHSKLFTMMALKYP